eukprot:5102564-Pleurochrysis_carterae.AAC.1
MLGRGSVSPGSQLCPKQQRCSKEKATHFLSKNNRSSASSAGAFRSVRRASRGQPQKPLFARCSQCLKQGRSQTIMGHTRNGGAAASLLPACLISELTLPRSLNSPLRKSRASRPARGAGCLLVVVDHAETKDAQVLGGLRRVRVVQDDGGNLELVKDGGNPGNDGRYWYIWSNEVGEEGHGALLAGVVGEHLVAYALERLEADAPIVSSLQCTFVQKK